MECLQGVTFNSPSLRCILPKRRRRGHKIKPFRLINKKMDQTSEANLLKAAAECSDDIPMETDEPKSHFRTVEEITAYWNQELKKVKDKINVRKFTSLRASICERINEAKHRARLLRGYRVFLNHINSQNV